MKHDLRQSFVITRDAAEAAETSQIDGRHFNSSEKSPYVRNRNYRYAERKKWIESVILTTCCNQFLFSRKEKKKLKNI